MSKGKHKYHFSMCKKCGLKKKYISICVGYWDQGITVQKYRKLVEKQGKKIDFLFRKLCKVEKDFSAWLEDWRTIGEIMDEEVVALVEQHVDAFVETERNLRHRLKKYEIESSLKVEVLEL